MRGDNGGEFWNYVIGGVVGAVVGGVSAAISGGDWKSIALGAVSGAASGLVAASGLGAVAQAGISAGISGLSNFAEQSVSKGIKNVNYFDVVTSAALGGVTALTGTAAGNKLGKSLNNAGSELINKGRDKLLAGYVRQSVGQSHSALIRQGRKYVAQGIQKINTARGISSSVGSAISSAVNVGYSYAKSRLLGW